MGKKSKKKKTDWSDSSAPSASLGDLLREAGLSGSSESAHDDGARNRGTEKPPSGSNKALDAVRSKIVVRFSRKGFGGKTATLVTGLDPDCVDLPLLAKDLRRSLGTGTRVDGDRIVIQGDQRERVQQWLIAQGGRNVIQG